MTQAGIRSMFSRLVCKYMFLFDEATDAIINLTSSVRLQVTMATHTCTKVPGKNLSQFMVLNDAGTKQ